MKTAAKASRKRPIVIILTVLCAVLAIPVLYITYFAGSFVLSCNVGQSAQTRSIAERAAALNGIVVITGMKLNAAGHASGDCLTGNPDTTTADATLTYNGSLATAKADVEQNLANQGYHAPGPTTLERNASYTGFSSAGNIYMKDHSTLTITYKFSDKHFCANEQINCESLSLEPPNDKLSQAAINRVIVSYQTMRE